MLNTLFLVLVALVVVAPLACGYISCIRVALSLRKSRKQSRMVVFPTIPVTQPALPWSVDPFKNTEPEMPAVRP